MIKVYNLLPDIYYNESRDFQVFGRTFEVLFNYLKTNVDLVDENPLDTRSSYALIRLIAKTLGFESKHEYNIEDLRVLCSVFTKCLRNKGSKKSIETAIKALLHSQHIAKPFNVNVDSGNTKLELILPPETKDVILLEDLFDFILPAGFVYNVTYGEYVDDNAYDTILATSDSVVTKRFEHNSDLGRVATHDTPNTKVNSSDLANRSELEQTFTGVIANQ